MRTCGAIMPEKGHKHSYTFFWLCLALTALFCFYSESSQALAFDTNETIILKGKGEKLAENEGYLYLSVNTETEFEYITIWHVDGGKQVRFDNVSKGEHDALIKLKAGTYYWVRFKKYGLGGYFYYDLEKSDYPFTVAPGVINYPGEWSFDLEDKGNRGILKLGSINNYTSALENFKKHHRTLLKAYQFVFQGDIKDHFADHYHQQLNARQESETHTVQPLLDQVTVIEHEKNDNIDEEKANFLNIEKYFKNNNQSIGEMNPSGQFLFYTNTIEEYTTISILNLKTYESVVIYKEKIPQYSYIKTIKWIDEDSIFYSIHSPKGNLSMVVHLTIDDRLKITDAEHLLIPYHGKLVAPLAKQSNVIYFGNNVNYKIKRRGLYRIDTTNKKTIKKSLKKHYSPLKKLKGSIYWLTDHKGEVRFVITDYDESIDYWFLPNEPKAKWKKIKSYESYDDLIVPDKLSRDGLSFYVVTDEFTDKKTIQQFSTDDFSHKGGIHENNNINVESLISDPSSGELIGVRYLQNGYFKFDYFATDKDSLNELRKGNPSLQLFSIQNNMLANTVLVYGVNEYTKGSWYIYKTDTKKILKLFSEDAEYDQLAKGVFTPLSIKSVDDLDIEGYLVTPKDIKPTQKVPLIVIPHGGPIGIRDYAYGNHIQHFYASQGFATLKINYRGSGGFGKKFKESGNKQWGEKIESDINNMVDHVIENYAIDADGICSMGSSYGGYSAIMLTTLFPDRYKCVISFAGVTDISLMFSSSDFRYNEKVVKSFSEIVGDPETDLQKMVEKSPVYLTDKITNPIMLFHGEKDQRVTIEHSLRMKAMLDIKNKPVDMVIFKDEGHSFSHEETEVIYAARSLAFIKKHLSDSGVD